MKKAMIIFLLPICFQASAQSNTQSNDENKEVHKGFDKTKLFTGGSANLGFSSYYTSLGIAPQLGYSLTNWADAGITLNVNYTSQRDYNVYGDKLRQTVYGPGAFVRLFPVNFLFATAQYEFNMIHLNYIPAGNSSSYSPAKNSISASSLLLSGGYAGGRERGNNTYYFLSVSWDVLGNQNSPYIDGLGRSIPVIRAGYNIGLFQGRNRQYGRGRY